MAAPDILLVGQITIDDTVPSEPGIWQRRLGGNAFYSLAGAKLWCEPARLGMVARVPKDLPFDVFAILEAEGMSSQGLTRCNVAPLVEWILYEADGNRQSMPRNPELRDPAADLHTLYLRYLSHLAAISASADDVPAHWLPATAIHLAPQVIERHGYACQVLRGRMNLLSVDPSPHYSRNATPQSLFQQLPGITSFLPSQAEVQHLEPADGDWTSTTQELARSGFPEVLLKQGAKGCILAYAATQEVKRLPPAPSSPIDLTGAGDAFSGAYLANRALGHDARESAARATVTAAMVIECSGTEAALALRPKDAEARLLLYKS